MENKLDISSPNAVRERRASAVYWMGDMRELFGTQVYDSHMSPFSLHTGHTYLCHKQCGRVAHTSTTCPRPPDFAVERLRGEGLGQVAETSRRRPVTGHERKRFKRAMH